MLYYILYNNNIIQYIIYLKTNITFIYKLNKTTIIKINYGIHNTNYQGPSGTLSQRHHTNYHGPSLLLLMPLL